MELEINSKTKQSSSCATVGISCASLALPGQRRESAFDTFHFVIIIIIKIHLILSSSSLDFVIIVIKIHLVFHHFHHQYPSWPSNDKLITLVIPGRNCFSPSRLQFLSSLWSISPISSISSSQSSLSSLTNCSHLHYCWKGA